MKVKALLACLLFVPLLLCSCQTLSSTADNVKDEIRTRRGKGDAQAVSEQKPQPATGEKKPAAEAPAPSTEDKVEPTAPQKEQKPDQPAEPKEPASQKAAGQTSDDKPGEKEEKKPNASIFDRY